jgi:hypothetical protein
MTKAKIFLVGESEDDLVPMEESAYVKETHLQRLLVRYPDLLPGDQITRDDPRRWLLVAREMAVPGDEFEESGRWSLDHLFLDQDGIPTFVECKRASDTRSRREVVAQMLDYAANGTEYWGMDRLRQAATETAQAQGRDLDNEVLNLIDGEGELDVDTYWQTVEANLEAGRVRLLFVLDSPPKELRRLVEFLNEKMADVEVLAVEIKQYLSAGGQRAVVPRALGVSARRGKETGPPRRQLDRETFLTKCAPEIVPFFEHVLDRAQERGHEISWGTRSFSIREYLPESEKKASFVYGYFSRSFQFFFGYLKMMPEEERRALREELMSLGLFRETADLTLSAELDEEDLPLAREVYDLILEKIDDSTEKRGNDFSISCISCIIRQYSMTTMT